MKHTRILSILMILLLLCNLPAVADGFHPVTASPTPVPFSTISGTVTDSASGSALSGVRVECGGRSSLTDNAGHYEINGLLPGPVTVNFSKSSYISDSKTVTIDPGVDKTVDMRLSLESGTVTGTVSDATNPSLKLANVTVKCGTATATTNASGVYTLSGLSAGEQTLKFSRDGYIDNTQKVTVTAGNRKTLDVSMSALLASDEFRVVLRWGANPSDLDSHLLGTSPSDARPANQSYHIYYPSTSKGSSAMKAILDVDDTNGYGP